MDVGDEGDLIKRIKMGSLRSVPPNTFLGADCFSTFHFSEQ